jgi:AraC family transcriptional regulator
MTLHWARKTELIVLYVEPTAFGECGQLPWDFLGRDFSRLARRDPSLARLGGIFLNLCRQWDRPDPEFVEGIGLALASRTLAQFRCGDESSPGLRSGLPLDLVNQLTQYIDSHIGDTIRARDLARRVGLSPDHFARRFKITARMAPKQFVLRRRMERVYELLGSGKYNVTQAGREVGFDDPSHLNRCFRNIFGYSPIVALKGALPGPGNN